jgi:DNA end-binding protein Ku
MLELMHFAQEVLEPEGLKTSFGTELMTKEIEMAKALIDSLSSEWEPTKYQDRYQSAVREMIAAKIQNRPKTEKAKAPRPTGPVIDLLAVLQESLRENADKRTKRTAGARSSKPRSTGALVKQKRRKGALGMS